MARRSFMRRTAIAAAAIATASSGVGMAAADDDSENWYDQSLTPSGVGTFLLGEFGLGDDDTKQEADELWAQVFADAEEFENADNQQFDSLINNAESLEGYIREDGARVIANRTKEGDSEEEVVDAVEDHFAEQVANLEQTLYNWWTNRWQTFLRRAVRVAAQDELDISDVFYYRELQEDGGTLTEPFNDSGDSTMYFGFEEDTWRDIRDGDADDSVSNWDVFNIETPLLDDRSFEIPVGIAGHSAVYFPWSHHEDPDGTLSDIPGTDPTPTELYAEPGDGWVDDSLAEDAENDFMFGVQVHAPNDAYEERPTLLDARRWQEVHHELHQAYESVLDEAEMLVDTLYQPIKDGEVDAHDIGSGAAIIENLDELENWQEARAYFTAVGFPEAERAAKIETEYGVVLEGKLFWTIPDEDDGLPVAEMIDPEEEIGEIHMAAEILEVPDEEPDDTDIETPEAGDIVVPQLLEEFEITDVEDGEDGPLMFEQRGMVEPEDDPEDIAEDLREVYHIEEEIHEGDTNVNYEVDASVPGVPNPFDGDGAGLLGLGLIGIVILAVIGFVTDLIPGLGD